MAARYGTITGTSSGKDIDAMSITASEARKNLFPLIEQVNENREPIEITSKRGDAVLMARADFDALNETALLLRSPANAHRLLKSLAQANAGERSIQELS
jgi:antitoxin YefM